MKNDATFHAIESTDAGLFTAYVGLRQRVFHLHYEGLESGFGAPDRTDNISRFVYLFHGSAFAGGARLTIAQPGSYMPLPLEDHGFRLRDCQAMRHLNLMRNPYAEISRMAIDPACSRDFDASLTLAAELCRVSACHSVDTLFSICPPGAARLNQVNAAKLGVTFTRYPKIATAYGRDMWVCGFTNVISAMRGRRLCA